VNILAFDTSTSACSAALYYEKSPSPGVTLSSHEIAPRQHTSMILPMIQSLLDQAGLTMANMQAIAFGAGPGSLTGIRIATSLAQGLAYASALPVIPVSSLAAAAQAAYLKNGWIKLITAVDARMSEVYFGAYVVENNIVSPIINDLVTKLDALPALPAGEWCGVGDAFEIYGRELNDHYQGALLQTDKTILPTAEAVLCLAKERFKSGEMMDAADALPFYLR
jgi:tRNA threonylcarbamoyladenosine biosynthesis protein TsaB